VSRKCQMCQVLVGKATNFCADCAKVRKKEQKKARYRGKKVIVEKKCVTNACNTMIKSNKSYCEECRKERQKAADTRLYNKRRASMNLKPKKETKGGSIPMHFLVRGDISYNSIGCSLSCSA